MTREERIFQRIMAVFTDLQQMEVGDHRKIENEPFMALSLDVLADVPHGRIIALAHNSVMNGDLMADPDMQILVNFRPQKAAAMTFQNSYLGVYEECLYYDEGMLLSRPALQRDLNAFLDEWTKNIIDQGFVEAYADQEATDGE
ncbi:hypothetical protein FE236_02145 [Mariprofundus erugo]|uniref:DUF6908 domain-containing protein n=1 Tax=Mariprofundus erugo TaxID=2528639 RepID=UPI0010FE2470|nr:hypothetical protein [Mariprofundus erugo]TLS77923.1 hypothetical protein FE236_02145 [Mariprofundus erugo]